MPAVAADPRPALACARGAAALADFVAAARRLLVLTGAGVSTECGIPDYRGADGEWKRRPPIQLHEFVVDGRARRRYWARSLVGWRHFGRAAPGAAHRALARLERAGRVHHLLTQNVDGLHRRAGSRRVIDLHGTLDAVACLDCGTRVPRDHFQRSLRALNPSWADLQAPRAPDGDAALDAALDGVDFARFRVPDCARCGGTLKPTVVFFGENVPAPRTRSALARLAEADALLVVGSSLMVYSGYRYVREAQRHGKPVAALNLGRTRADAELDLKLEAPCGAALESIAGSVAPGETSSRQ